MSRRRSRRRSDGPRRRGRIRSALRAAFANEPDPLAACEDIITTLDRRTRLTLREARHVTFALVQAMNVGRRIGDRYWLALAEGASIELAIRDAADRLEGIWMLFTMAGVSIDHDRMADAVAERGYPAMAARYRLAADDLLTRFGRGVSSTGVH